MHSSIFVCPVCRSLSTAPYVSVAINLGFLGWAALNIGKGFGLGKTDYYDALDDSSVSSLARDAGEWALAGVVPTQSKDGKYEVATFAGGCFWGTELHFQRLPGVIDTCVGYTHGSIEKPSYAQVCTGTTGHTEGLQITFDPTEISFERLCDKLLATVDATLLNRVGNDRGTQVRDHPSYPLPWPSMAFHGLFKPSQAFSSLLSRAALKHSAVPSWHLLSLPRAAGGGEAFPRQGATPLAERARRDRVQAGQGLLAGGELPPALPSKGRAGR